MTLALNKPLGCVTALRDPRHPTAYELLAEAPLFGELRPVGRLDLDTSGLLIWSTDGTEIQRLTHPKPRCHGPTRRRWRGHSRHCRTSWFSTTHEPKISGLEPLSRDPAHPT